MLYANKLNTRSAIMLFVATVRGVWSGFEQPASSQLKYFPYFELLRVVLELCNATTPWQKTSLQLASIAVEANIVV